MSGPSYDMNEDSKDTMAQLPVELFYPICTHIASRRVLLELATVSRVLQRPSEAALHRKVTLDTRGSGKRFIATIRDCPRFAPLVWELRLEQWPHNWESEDVEYWEGIRDTLGELRSLSSLIVDDGRDIPFSWVLSVLPSNRLRIFHCAFILDTDLLRTLQKQNLLEEFAWKGGLIRLPVTPIADGGEQDNTARILDDQGNPLHDPPISDSDEPLISTIQCYLNLPALPRLKYLTSESVALARALVPGRAITHLWVPGATFSAYPSEDFLNDQFRFLKPETSSSERIQTARPRLDSSSIERSEQIRRAAKDFSLSRGPVLSLRMQLDLHHPELMDVLYCIAQKLPELRTFGFLPAYVLEHPHGDSSPEYTIPFPGFRHLQTLCLSSTPSRYALSRLQASSSHPALRTVACLHYSPAFEWLCLPINDDINTFTNIHRNGIRWNIETRVDGGTTKRLRRVTPVHDPEHMLWRVV